MKKLALFDRLFDERGMQIDRFNIKSINRGVMSTTRRRRLRDDRIRIADGYFLLFC